MRIRTLGDLAAAINNIKGTGYKAIVERSWSSTDRQPKGLRYITRKGKGRKGTKLTVTDPTGKVVISCDTSHTTPVCVALTAAKKLFGRKLDLRTDTVYEPGRRVRIVSHLNIRGYVLKTITTDGVVTHYDVRFPSGHTDRVEAWEVQH